MYAYIYAYMYACTYDIINQTYSIQRNTRGGYWHVDHNTELVYMRVRLEVIYI